MGCSSPLSPFPWTLHFEHGFANPLLSSWSLQLLLMGIDKTHGRPPKQMLPITSNNKYYFVANVHASTVGSFLDHFTLCFAGAACFLFCRKATLRLVPKSVGLDGRDSGLFVVITCSLCPRALSSASAKSKHYSADSVY